MFNKKKRVESAERPGLVVLNKPSSVVSEQFRTVKTNIQFSMVDETLRTIVVTSAGPASGKSTIAANLAATFASNEKKVLLVDADLRKPTVHKTFKVRNNDGLTTLLTDRNASLEEVIYRTHSDGLYVLTSGAIPPNPAELLASKRMEEIKQEMLDYFDMVIFDTPPLLAVTDAQVMASKSEGVIFVIPKGLANKEEVIKAKDLLEKVQANVLGAILNRVDKSDDSYYYYYGE
ncbi:CpsD/CapB family tyrosine-protein kinase [Alkalibacterium olivapovliticus]|uniref:Tyrosine-protein kinase CpsD n=1 Tax=Alkalibacterium olivapovliticus TaxID=99907 RepID=A0A2T0W7M0_9LACT|nr:CpsD/CapB family tyrosine-protein kinase [Alkalibacterium olivapovliticus]PRY82685.1 capsular exopolysaccharide synthesis family protein [Alkalibacterium olivapovliticus]